MRKMFPKRRVSSLGLLPIPFFLSPLSAGQRQQPTDQTGSGTTAGGKNLQPPPPNQQSPPYNRLWRPKILFGSTPGSASITSLELAGTGNKKGKIHDRTGRPKASYCPAKKEK